MSSSDKLPARLSACLLALALATAAIGGGDDRPGDDTLRWSEDSDISQPEVLHKVDPIYPEAARKDKAAGLVVLHSVVTTDGAVAEVEVLEDPDSRLTAAAVAALRQWRFEPARDDSGRAVEVWYRVTFRFALE